MSKTVKIKVGRSAITGQFKKLSFVKTHPKTTITQTIKIKRGKK